MLTTKSNERLAKVHPLLAEKVRQLCETLARDGLDIQVVQGLRTFAEQDALFAQGRTKAGPKVTNARGGQSNHNFGLAVDVCPFVNGKPQWEDNATFQKIGKEAKLLKLEWGGDWVKFNDRPHVQLPGLSMKDCNTIYNKSGRVLQRVWDAATAAFVQKV
jgi:peptidoglycan L-alanyl-D-glutamate endopeptidase CwlK